MTTATLQFDLNHPTLFQGGRFTRDDQSPKPEPTRAPSPVRIAVPDAERRAGTVHPHGPAEAGGVRGGETPRRLDEVLSAAWDGLAAHHSVTCPVCSGSMAPRYGSGAKPVGGRCTRCGSTLG
jgi:hypothetical protein